MPQRSVTALSLPLIALLTLGSAAACRDSSAVAADAARPARSWPKPVFVTKNNEFTATGWKLGKNGRNSPEPDNPAAPMFIDYPHTRPMDGAAGFAGALKAAGIGPVQGAKTFPVETMQELPGMEGQKGWASGAMVNVGGQEQALFAVTSYSINKKKHVTTLFQVPRESLRQWGGVRMFVDLYGVGEDAGFVPAKIWDDGTKVPPADQAQLFAGIFDAVVTRLLQQGLAIQQQTIQNLMAINQDQNKDLNCWRSSGCTYVPGAAPGQGKAVQQ